MMSEKLQYIMDCEKAKLWTAELFEKTGVPHEDAKLVADCLIDADLSGLGSHGVMRIPSYIDHLEHGGFSKECKLEVLKETATTAALDAHAGIGIVCAYRAMEMAIKKAKENGMAIVTVRNSNHFGATGYYTRMAAKEGMIGFGTTNCAPAIAPWGSYRSYFGTNPFSASFPTSEEPVVLDMATSVVARGKVMLAKEKGEKIPTGWALDEKGNPTTDPEAALKGTMLPFGGVKGSGLALGVEIMSAVLSGAASGTHITPFSHLDKGQNVGHCFVAIDIKRLIPYSEYLDGMNLLLSDIRALPRIAGVNKMYMPGEPECEKRKLNGVNGVQISSSVYDSLSALSKQYEISFDILK